MTTFRIEVVVDPRRATAGSKTVERGLQRVENRADRLRATLARAFAAAGITLGIGAGIRLLADFSQEMSTVQAITQATDQDFQRLNARAQELGSTTRFSATQAAEGMVFLARAGFEANEVFETIDDTLQLAQAGALELGRAADIASNVLTGFRLETDQASRVVDVLALAANSANTDVGQLGDALKFVAPIAAGVGVSMEDATAAIATLSNAGLQASLAGTGLRRVLSELESPSAATQSVIEDLNSSIEKNEISVTGLFAALQKLQEAGVDTGAALEIFGDRGGPAFEVLSNGIQSSKDLADELRNAEGTAARIAATMDDNLNGALLSVKSAFEGLILALGENDGAIDSLEDGVRDIAEFFRFLTANVETTAKVLTTLAIAVIVGVLIPALASLAAAIIANPLTLIPGIIALAIGAIIAFRDELAELEVFGVRVGDAVTAVFGAIKARVEFVLPTILELVKIVFSDIVEATMLAFNEVGNLISSALSFVGDAFQSVFGGSGTALDVVKTFANIVIAIFKSIGDAINRTIDGFIESFQILSEFDFSSPIESARRVLSSGIANVGDKFGSLTEDIQSNFETDYIELFADTGRMAAEALFDGFEGLSGSEAIKAFLDIGGDINERLAEAEAKRLAEAFAAQYAGALAASVAAQVAFFGGGGGPLATPGGAATSTPSTSTGPSAEEKQALEDQARLLESIQGPAQEYARTLAALDVLFQQNKISAEEYNLTLRQVQASSAALDNTVSGGLAGGLAEIQLQISDVAGTIQFSLVNAFGEAKNALLDFTRTGKLNFDGLISSILDGLAELAINALFKELIGGATEGAAGGGLGGLLGGLLSSFGGVAAEGADVRSPGKTFLVGEQGPELFTPPSAGRIVPAGETAAILSGPRETPAPVVNVNVAPAPVTIVDDPRRVIDAMRSRDGQEAQMVNLRENRMAARGTLSQ